MRNTRANWVLVAALGGVFVWRIASAESAVVDLSAACNCDDDCATFGTAARCNNYVCTPGGNGTPCTAPEAGPETSVEDGGPTDPRDAGADLNHDGGAQTDMLVRHGDEAAAAEHESGGCRVAAGEGVSMTLLALLLLVLVLARRRNVRRSGDALGSYVS